MKNLLIIIICTVIGYGAPKAQSLMQQADSLYSLEDYRAAIKLYQKAIDTDGISPEIYYNLGNAYYRIGNLGRSVLCYQRALNIDPSYDDARTNLNFVKTKILDRPEDDSSFLENLHESILSGCSPNAWAWITLLLFAMLLGCIALYIFASNVLLRKTGFFGGGVVLILTIYASIISYQSSSRLHSSNMAVITSPSATLRSEPGSESTDKSRIISLNEGTILQITDSITMPSETSAPKWYCVKINNSTQAWINAADVEHI